MLPRRTLLTIALITAGLVATAPVVAQETVLDRARDALQQAGEHIEDAARDAGRDVSGYLADNPDLNRDLFDFGNRIGLPGFDEARPNPGPVLVAAPDTVAAGTRVRLSATGLAGDETVTIAAGRSTDNAERLQTATTTARGALDTVVSVPESASPGEPLVFTVETGDRRLRLASGPVKVVAATDLVTVIGTLSNEGVTCPALRGDDGELYTLATRDLGSFAAGDRVKVTGTVAEVSICMQGTTVAITAITAAP
ncbi:MAG: hypothetical protein GY798_29080 [Hyphomicrobiales bacterium]|nr:hypothetical protein [Hyphomicrobiales bacterium]